MLRNEPNLGGVSAASDQEPVARSRDSPGESFGCETNPILA